MQEATCATDGALNLPADDACALPWCDGGHGPTVPGTAHGMVVHEREGGSYALRWQQINDQHLTVPVFRAQVEVGTHDFSAEECRAVSGILTGSDSAGIAQLGRVFGIAAKMIHQITYACAVPWCEVDHESSPHNGVHEAELLDDDVCRVTLVQDRSEADGWTSLPVVRTRSYADSGDGRRPCDLRASVAREAGEIFAKHENPRVAEWGRSYIAAADLVEQHTTDLPTVVLPALP